MTISLDDTTDGADRIALSASQAQKLNELPSFSDFAEVALTGNENDLTVLRPISMIGGSGFLVDAIDYPEFVSGLITTSNLSSYTGSFASTSDVTTALAGKVDVVSGKDLSTNDYTSAEKTKLSGIASGATANSSDATLVARANHTGTESADVIIDGTTNKVFTATMSTKLAGVAAGATANSSDATLLARANHTGTQAISTVTGLQTALDAKYAIPTPGSHIANGATDAATNASTTQVTNYNTLSGLLGISAGLNDANTAQNDLATKYNAAAGKLNDLATKFNTLNAHLQTLGLQST